MNNLLIKRSLLFVILLITSSCSSNDDESNQTDPIIGLWEYSTQFLNDVQTTVTDCEPSTIEFTDQGNRTDLYYSDNSGDCIIVDTVNMSWEYLDNDDYQFTQNGFSFSETVTFQNGNNTLTLESSDADGNGDINVHRFVYNRID